MPRLGAPVAPTIRPAYNARERRELDALAELAARTPALDGSYDRARALVLEGLDAVDAAQRAIAERRPRTR